MKTLFQISLIGILFFVGCTTHVLKLNFDLGLENISTSFSGSNGNHFIDEEFGDSIRIKWVASTRGSFKNNTFAALDSFVFISDLSGRIYCFNIFSGKEKGVLNYKGSIQCAPIINDFFVYTSVVKPNENKSEFIIFDYFKSKEIKTVDIEGRITNEMLLQNDAISLLSEEVTLYKINLKGEIEFSVKTESFVHSSPVAVDEFILFGNDKGEITRINSSNGKIVSSVSVSTKPLLGSVIKDDLLIIGSQDGFLYFYNWKDDKVVAKINCGSSIIASPSYDDKSVYVSTAAGILFAFQINKFKLLWMTELGGLLNSSPLVLRSKLIVNNLAKSFTILNKFDGTVIQELELDGRGKTIPFFYKNILLIGYDDRDIIAYEIY